MHGCGPFRKLPLDGVHVVDFGHWVAGPLAAEILANLGASVIKVEQFRGDPLGRSLPGPYGVVNRGKYSLAANLKAPGAHEVVRRLVMWSDVVTSNYRPGVADRLGFGTDRLAAIDPSVVVLESTAYGNGGPSADRPGFDPIFLAKSGHAHRAGGSDGPPVCATRLGAIDSGTGMLGAFAAATGLYRSRRTGTGGFVGVSLLDASLFLMGEVERDSTGAVVGPATLDRDRTGVHPAEALYQLQDCWAAIVATSETARRSLVCALGLSAMASQPSRCWGQSEHDAISAVLCQLPLNEVEHRLAGSDVSVVPCATDAKARTLSNAALIDAGLVVPAEEPASGCFTGFPVTFEHTQTLGPEAAHVPRLGEHTDTALHMIGFTQAEIIGLRAANVVTGEA